LAELAQAAPYPFIRLPFGWQKAFLFLTAVLASTIDLKFGAIQYLEVIYFGLIFLLLILFVEAGYRGTMYRVILWMAILYLCFCLAALALGIASLRFNFYFPAYVPPLKRPLIITIARIVELIASVTAMLYMGQIFGRDINKARFTMVVYFWTGVASGIYSVLCIPINMSGHGIPGPILIGAYEANRLRGFYNEGGPYGLYVISLLIIGYAIDRLGWISRRRVRLAMAFLCIIFVMCYSKAGFLAVITVFAFNGLFARSLTQRLIILGSGLAIFIGITQIVDLPAVLRGYEASAAQYERLSHYHKEDANFVYGRIAGAFIVPRMIAAHPLTGIGWGNYGLLRNAPEYRGGAVFTEGADDPGLGMFGLAAEIGLPLLGGLLVVLLLPYFYLRHLKAPIWLSNLALVQPIVHVYGAQLNLTYPWVVTAFALGLGLFWSSQGGFPQENDQLQVS
jgi:hypothetical protein